MHLAQRFGARKFAKTNLKNRPKFSWKKYKTHEKQQDEHDLAVTSELNHKIQASSTKVSNSAYMLYRTSKQVRAVDKQIQALVLEAENIKRQLAEKKMLIEPLDKRLQEQKKQLKRQSSELSELRTANFEIFHFGVGGKNSDEKDDDEDEDDKDDSENDGKSDSESVEFTDVDLDPVWYVLSTYGRIWSIDSFPPIVIASLQNV